MTKLNCRECGKPIGDIEADRVVVRYKGLEVEVERGRIGCGHMVRRGYDQDGAQRWSPCGAMTPVVVEARIPIPV